ncbi:GMC family oxidoreductase [Hahella sp. SMD15-11]|uniref:GMC family oxidoreductase n=1 Tax=Thermohahella caldifontis TaxID=3142973 RepID=A0AB39UWF8_9GAMM
MDKFWDYIIIGSGAGGSVLAERLVRAGARCLMLEAGQRYRPEDYPANELHANTRLMWHGGMDMSEDAGLLFLRGKTLGGGTVINQALLDRFDELAWSDWRERSGIDDFSVEAMAPHYEAVESELSLQTIPEQHWNGNARLYVEGFEACGYRWAPLRRGQRGCSPDNDCIQCLGGCRRASKQSMAVTFLPRAEAAGLEILTACHVDRVHPGPHYAVVQGRMRGRPHTWYARKVVLAAGALGTTEILLRSGLARHLPALGQHFWCHPQFMTLAMMRDVVDAHKGALQAVKSDDPRFRQQGFKLENVFAGPIAVSMLKAGFGPAHQRFMKDYRHLACIEVAVRDVTPGTLRLDNQSRLRIHKPLGDPEWARARAGQQAIENIFEAVGAETIDHARLRIGLHLMGGAVMGTDDRTSVVAPDGHVHGMPSLMVADGSLFPSAPGINPSLTIMAMAQRIAGIETGSVSSREQAEEVSA